MVTKGRIEAANISTSSFEIIDSEEFSSIYQKEWESSFANKFYLKQIKSSAVKGMLKVSHFRSICWKVFLSCLPVDRSQWIDTVNSQRHQYQEILDKFNTNPRDTDSLDINVNNPLSQSQQSPWNQYFQDSELRLTIQQDVVRTFPEIEFFHTPDIQDMMTSILFSFAREFPHISYRQGMHELLAPILFVLYYDQQAYLQASETDNLDLEIRILLNKNYIEHDAFYLFCKLMEVVEPWYTMNEYSSSSYVPLTEAEPFSQIRTFTGNLLGEKLRRIFECLLKRHDPELFTHLEQMEITPQIFGIRWLRLLFGREFSIHDLLIIWDAIFADSTSFDLVDFIFIAMLISIREFLLHDDYASCLNHLMRFPNVVDVHYIVNLGLYLRDPESVKKPEIHAIKIINPLQLKSPKIEKPTLNKVFSKSPSPGIVKSIKTHALPKKGSENRPKSLSIASLQIGRSNPDPRVPSGNGVKPNLCDKKVQTPPLESNDCLSPSESFDALEYNVGHRSTSYTLPRTRIRNVMENTNHKFRAMEISQIHSTDKYHPCETTYREMVSLVPSSVSPLTGAEPCNSKMKIESKNSDPEIVKLKKEITELKLMNKYCCREMSLNLEKLQEAMMRQHSIFEDEMFIALAGLKRARDILKGTVSFMEEVLGDETNLYCSFSSNRSKDSRENSPSDIPKTLEHDIKEQTSKNILKNKSSPVDSQKTVPITQSSSCDFSSGLSAHEETSNKKQEKPLPVTSKSKWNFVVLSDS